MKNYDKFKFIADKLKKQQEKNKQKKLSKESPVKKNNGNTSKKVPKKPSKKTNKKDNVKPSKAIPEVKVDATDDEKLKEIDTLKVPETKPNTKKSIWKMITDLFK